MYISGRQKTVDRSGYSLSPAPYFACSNLRAKTADNCAIIKSNMDDGAFDMSFVGLLIRENKIIGFGDTRASINDGNMVYRLDKARGLVPKVFKNDAFIFVAHATNNYRKLWKMWNVDQWINEHLQDYDSYEAMLEGFRNEIAEGNNRVHYGFIIGSCDQNGLFVRAANINDLQIQYGDKIYEKALFCAGAEQYTDKVNEIHQAIVGHEEQGRNTEESTRIVVEGAINYFNTKPGYNPAGLPVLTATWTP